MPPPFDPSTKTTEELGNILNLGSISKMAEAIEAEDNPPEQGPETETKKEPEPEQKPPEKAAPSEPGPEEEDPKIAEIRLLLEEQSLNNQKLAGELERQKLLASREAGRAGHFKREAELRQRRPKAEPAEDIELDEFGEPAEDKREPVPTGRRQRDDDLDDIRAEIKMRAFEDEASTFFLRRPDANEEKFKARLMPHLTRLEEENADEIHGSDIKLARLTARTVFEAAYVEARLEALAEQKEAVKARRAEQFSQAREAKTTASSAGSGQASASKSSKKDLSEMSIDDLDKVIKELTG